MGGLYTCTQSQPQLEQLLLCAFLSPQDRLILDHSRVYFMLPVPHSLF